MTSPDESFRATFLEYHPRLFRYFRAAGFSPADAEDLCQKSLLNVYRGRGDLRQAELFTSWVYTVARNAARDEWRRRGDVRRFEPVDESVPAAAPSPEHEVEVRQRLERVRAGLLTLPARMRACFLMRVQEELSYQEIAGRLSLSPGTVKIQVWNARRRLKEVLL